MEGGEIAATGEGEVPIDAQAGRMKGDDAEDVGEDDAGTTTQASDIEAVDDDTAHEEDVSFTETQMHVSEIEKLFQPPPRSTAELPQLRPSKRPQPETQSNPPIGAHQYEKQETIARDLLKKMQDVLAQTGSSSAYTNVQFFIQLPDLNSIYTQTVERVDEYLKKYREDGNPGFFAGWSAEQVVYKASLATKSNKVNKQIKQSLSSNTQHMVQGIRRRIQDQPSTLFIIIHDEAHWAATRGGAADLCINDTVMLRDNVLTLFVSATPYNLLTADSQVPMENELNWFEPGEDTKYYGITDYLKASGTTGSPGQITVDEEFEKHAKRLFDNDWKQQPALKAKRKADKQERKADKQAQARLQALIQEYVVALRTKMGASETTGTTSHLTTQMIGSLLTPKSDGRGIMILLRTLSNAAANLISRALKEARQHLGLQDRFAVIVDTQHKSTGLQEAVPPELFEQAKVWSGKEHFRIATYNDLADIPCVLILCEKGKMGDTFPKSLRYYDMRLRYANSIASRAMAEQDLGRGCRYNVDRNYELPTIVMGPGCQRLLDVESKRSSKNADGQVQARGILRVDPDFPNKMVKKPGTKACKAYPRNEQDLSAYRESWEAGPKHFDYHRGTVPNPRRFVLVGRPQIGKTGAYLHLVYLMWKAITSKALTDAPPKPPEPPPKKVIIRVICKPRNEEAPADGNMNEFPRYDIMEAQKFEPRKPSPGKYGDPSDEGVWKWYVDEGKAEKHPTAANGSTATRMRGETNHALSAPAEGNASVAEREPSTQELQLPDVRHQSYNWHNSRTKPNGAPAFLEGKKTLAGQELILHIPTCSEGLWDLDSCQIKEDVLDIPFPILIPSSGRPQDAYLDLSETLDGLSCIQIVVVKSSELQTYQRHWPKLTFCELPKGKADAPTGIGWSRYWIMQLAHGIVQSDQKYCFMMDDSVRLWRGVTLVSDPHPRWKKGPSSEKSKSEPVSLRQVLEFLKDDRFEDRSRFGAIGFVRYNGDYRQRRAYARKHVYSATFFNVTLLKSKNIEFNPNLYVWEDLDFNLRADDAGVVMCKCYRFAQYKAQMQSGGCNAFIASVEPEPKPGEDLASPEPEPKSDEDLASVLRSCGLVEHMVSFTNQFRNLDGLIEVWRDDRPGCISIIHATDFALGESRLKKWLKRNS
eukprot:TRINITY_DN1580_c0_g1_i11.p1 TRINITY_DN1580_c0_g1~~TRINITY_DN1580_c0_g1_i11.p1  ORF type:complete len:1156 (-),score=118.62 TRINITY_DN1580_c0_g1_i11:494-3961(-)